jgi:hypothetical protein
MNIKDIGTKEEIALYELFKNNNNLQSIKARSYKRGAYKGQILITICYFDGDVTEKETEEFHKKEV